MILFFYIYVLDKRYDYLAWFKIKQLESFAYFYRSFSVELLLYSSNARITVAVNKKPLTAAKNCFCVYIKINIQKNDLLLIVISGKL